MKRIKRFVKELKRVRFATLNETGKVFFKSCLFIIFASLFLLIITLIFSAIWQAIGIGL